MVLIRMVYFDYYIFVKLIYPLPEFFVFFLNYA